MIFPYNQTFLNITGQGGVFVSDLHNDIYSLEKILEFFRINRRNKKVHYLIFLGDCIDVYGHYELIFPQLYSIIEEFPNDVFFIKGNHECAFYDIFFERQPEIKNFLKLLRVSLLVKDRDVNIFCSHGGIPLRKDKKGVFKICKKEEDYNLHCIYNFNEFSGEKVYLESKDFFYDSFRNSGCIIPNCIEFFFLKEQKINYCITGHVHKNQRIVNQYGNLKHVTICSSKEIRSGSKIPTAYVIFNDGKNMFLNLNDFSENKFVDELIFN